MMTPRTNHHIPTSLARAVLLVCVLAWSAPAWAQVAHDGETVLQNHLSATDPHTISGKTTAGSNRVGILHIHLTNASFASNPASAPTWNGVAMTEIGTGQNIALAGGVRSYCIANPPTSASDIVVDMTASLELGYIITSYNGVDQTTPCESAAGATGTSTTPTVDVSSESGDMVVSVVSVNGTISATGSGQTQEGTDVTDGGAYTMRASREGGAASVTMDYTTSNNNWSTQGFSINAAAGGGGGGGHATIIGGGVF